MNRKQKDKKQKLSELGDGVYAAEKLLKKRKQRGQIEYLVKWKGWSDKDNTWEPIGNIIDKRLIQEFEQNNKNESLNKSLSRNKKSNNRLSLEDEKIKSLNKDILDNENSNSSSKSDDTIENTDLNESQIDNRSLKEIQIEEPLKEEIKKDKLDKKEIKIEIKELEIKLPSENNVEINSNVKKKNEIDEIENKESNEKSLPDTLIIDTNTNKNEVSITKSKIEIKENKTENLKKENIATKTEINKLNENKNDSKLEIIPVVNLNKTKTLCDNTFISQPIRFNDKVNLPKKEQEIKEQPIIPKPIINNTSSTITNNFNQLVNNKQLTNSIQTKTQYTIVNVPTINQQNVLINKVSLPSIKPINLNSKSLNNGQIDDSTSNTENTLNFIKSVNPITKSSINLPKTTLNNSNVSISFSSSYTNNLINNLSTINSTLNSKLNSTNMLGSLINNTCNNLITKNSTPNLISNNIKKNNINLNKPLVKNKISSPQVIKSNDLINTKATETTIKKIKSPIIKNMNCTQELKPITNNLVTAIPSLNVNHLLNNQKINDLNKLEKNETVDLKKEENKNQMSNFKQISTAILQSKQKNIKRWTPPMEFWKKQSILVNQVIVTDIKNNDNEIITIRESKTPHGFFKKKSVKKKKKLSKNETINGV